MPISSASLPLIDRTEAVTPNILYWLHVGSDRMDSACRNPCCDIVYFLLLSIKASCIYLSYEMFNAGVAIVSYESLNSRLASTNIYSSFANGVINSFALHGSNFHERLAFDAVINKKISEDLAVPYLLGVTFGESSALLVLTAICSLQAKYNSHSQYSSKSASAFSIVFISNCYSVLLLMFIHSSLSTLHLGSSTVVKNALYDYPGSLNPLSNRVRSYNQYLFGPTKCLMYPGYANRTFTANYFNGANSVLSSNSWLSSLGWDPQVAGGLMIAAGSILTPLITVMTPSCFNYLFKGYGSHVRCIYDRVLHYKMLMIIIGAAVTFLTQLESSKLLIVTALSINGLLLLDKDRAKDSTNSLYYSWVGMMLGSIMYDLHAGALLDQDNTMVMGFKWVRALVSLLTVISSVFAHIVTDPCRCHPCISPSDNILNCIDGQKSYYFCLPVAISASMFFSTVLISMLLSMSDFIENNNDTNVTVIDISNLTGSSSNFSFTP